MGDRATETGLTPMSLASQGQGCLGGGTPSVTTLFDALPLHICHLGKHGYDKLPYAATDRTKPPNVYGDTLFKQLANDGLNIKGVTA